MPKFDNIIKIEKDEKNLYNVLKGLEVHREYLVDGSSKEWHGTMRKFGIRTKKLIKKELIEPPWEQRDANNRTVVKRLFRLPDNVIVEEKNGNNMCFFHFKRRKVV